MKNLIVSFLALVSTLSFAQSQECVKIKASKNPADRSINLVFVPSGFGANLDEFEATVRRHWRTIEQYEPFGPQVDTMNVTIVKASTRSDSFCDFYSPVDRLLTCNMLKAYSLAGSCVSRRNRQIVVIHNTDRHGGSGGDVATATNSPHSATVIVHEIGHSLFKLDDEYTRSDGSASGPNCTSEANKCASWQDLINAGLATCESGCRNNASYTSSPNIMRSLDQTSFGHANQRNICCTFQKMTGEYPQFCEQYRNVGEGIDRYCRR